MNADPAAGPLIDFLDGVPADAAWGVLVWAVLVWGEMINVIIARPGSTPDDAEMHTYMLVRHDADAPRSQPLAVEMPVDGDLGWVLNQDTTVLASMQRGLRQPGFTHLQISSEECRIVNMHRSLERMLDIGPDDPA